MGVTDEGVEAAAQAMTRADLHLAAIRGVRWLRLAGATPTTYGEGPGAMLRPSEEPLDASGAAALAAVAEWFAASGELPVPTGRPGMVPRMPRSTGRGRPIAKVDPDEVVRVMLLVRSGSRVWLRVTDDCRGWRAFEGLGRPAEATRLAASEASWDIGEVRGGPPEPLGAPTVVRVLRGPAGSGPATLVAVVEEDAAPVLASGIDHATGVRPFDADEVGALKAGGVLEGDVAEALRRLGWSRPPRRSPTRGAALPATGADDPWRGAPAVLAEAARRVPDDDPDVATALALAALLAATGCRLRDALETPASGVGVPHHGRVTVGTGRRAAEHACPAWLGRALERVMPEAGLGEGPLFRSDRGPHRMRKDEARAALDALAERAGMASARPSALRRVGVVMRNDEGRTR